MPRAVLYDRFGTAEVLEIKHIPEVHATEGRARVAVVAVGLNPFDFKMRSGAIPIGDPRFPRGLGGDFAGVIDEVGEGASYWDGAPVKPGDEVLGWSDAGTLREQLVVPTAQLARKPAALSWHVAASLSGPAQTADAALKALAIGPSDTVLLSAAAGGVGFVYAQLARARGASVIGTASPGNFDALERIGVVPTTYGPELADRVRALAPGGITAVQDNFGRETIDAGFALGLTADRICTIVDHEAVTELGLASPGRYARSAERLEGFARLAAEGGLQLPIQSVFALAQVREAFELLEGRHLSGKVVVTLT